MTEKNNGKKASEESGIGTDSLPKDDLQEETEIIVPPDGGWGWVVVAASFFCTFMVDGIVNSVGLLLTPMEKDLNESKATMAFVSSLLSGFYLLAGPFVSGLANRYGFRIVTIAGSIFAAICFAVSYFANDVYFILVIFSVLGGIGCSMIYIPAVITVGFYFERWRALATGIAMCGSGVGTFVFPPIVSILLGSIGWRGTFVVFGGLILTCVICGALFRPLKPIKVAITNGDENKVEIVKTLGSGTRLGSGLVYIPPEMEDKATPHTWMGVAPNDTYPTAAEVFRKSHTNLEMRRSSASAAGIKAQLAQGNGQTKKNYIVVAVKESDENGANGKNENTAPLLNDRFRILTSEQEKEGKIISHSRTPAHSRRGTLTSDTQVSRPLYREDIFFGGSLKKIPQYQSKTSIGYHLSVTHLPTVTDVNEEAEAGCRICPEAVKRTLVTMLDFSLLVSPTFLLLAFSGLFSMLGFYAPFIYLTDRGEVEGMSKESTVWLLSAIGVANTIGRILCGVVSSIDGINTLWINNVAITIGGIATIASAISYSVGYQYTYCVIFGLSIACFASLRSIIVVELMGLEKLTNAFGLLMMFQGIAAVAGAPIAGALKDATGGYDMSFYVAGAFYTFSAFLCYPLNYVNKWEQSKEKKADVV